MNTETLRMLAEQMQIAPDDIIQIDADFKRNEATVNDEVKEFIDKQVENIKTILTDETISMGVRVGYVLSSAGLCVARGANEFPSVVYYNLYQQSRELERDFLLNSIFEKLMDSLGSDEQS